MRPKAIVMTGLGIGCHEETAHAYMRAGADAEIVHIGKLLRGELDLSNIQIINLSGGFMNGDILGAGMCAANELEHAVTKKGERMKDALWKFAERGLIYGQCNGFQDLEKAGLLPAVDNDYSRQTATLTANDIGNYFVSPVLHGIETDHFAFKGFDEPIWLWCRHGEGKQQFYSTNGSVLKSEACNIEDNVNKRHVLLRYVDPSTFMPTEKFPYNPNGSHYAIAGLMTENGHIFGHMAHPEVSVYLSRNSQFFRMKDTWRRQGIKAEHITPKMLEDVGLKIFKNVVNYFK